MTPSVLSARSGRLNAHLLFAGAVLASLMPIPGIAGEYEFSDGPHRFEWTPGYWHGKHEFPGVYCLTFPRPQSAASLDTGLLNGNAITFVRANYDDRIAAYVVTSTLPEGLSEADDLASLMANEQRNATQTSAAGGYYVVDRIDTRMGPGITVRIANVLEDAPNGPFPLVRHVFAKDKGPIVTMSSHRWFVRGGHRFEVAVLGAPDATLGDGARAALQEKIDAHADQMLASLQECTAKIPPSWVKQTNRPSKRVAADIGGPAATEMEPADASISAAAENDRIRARATELQSRGDHARALPLWEQLAANGDKDSMIDAGLIHHQGLGGVPVDYGKAIDWYLKAENGDALNNLGSCTATDWDCRETGRSRTCCSWSSTWAAWVWKPRSRGPTGICAGRSRS